MTAKQWARLGASAAILAGIGVALVRMAPKSANTPPTVAQTASATSSPTSAVSVDTVYQWPGIVAADSVTGALRSDLGWRNGAQSAPAHGLAYCAVATQTHPTFRRVLVAPKGAILSLASNPAAYTLSACTRAFHQWDSLETTSDGRWPNP